MPYRIVSDSSCDIWALEGAELRTVPLTISTGERTFVDDDTIDVHDMLTYLAQYKGRSYTACPNTEAWIDAFGGCDEVYVVTMTSTLSGTYNSAVVARDIYLEKHPGAKVLVVDTLSTSGEQLLILEKIRDLKSAGCTFQEVEEQISAYRKTTRLFFAFRSLHNLAQNGRLPKLVAQAIGVLGISVIGTASEKGTVEPTSKGRGRNAVIKNLYAQMTKAGYKGGKVNICHVENEELAGQIADCIRQSYPDARIAIYPVRGLVAYYGEQYGVVLGCEC